jgi:hypothetical protein
MTTTSARKNLEATERILLFDSRIPAMRHRFARLKIPWIVIEWNDWEVQNRDTSFSRTCR